MNRKAALFLLASLVLHHTSPLAALAGGAVFVGSAPRPTVASAPPHLVPDPRGFPAKLIES